MNNLLLIENRNLFRGSIAPKKGLNLKKKGGRNNTGKIITRYTGGGFRILLKNIQSKSGRLENIVLNSSKNSYLSWCRSSNGFGFYRLINFNRMYEIGNLLPFQPLKNFLVGDLVFCLPNKIGGEGIIARAIGSFCTIIKQELIFTTIRVPSGKIFKLNSSVYCFFGFPSGQFKNKNKAGCNRRKGIRPKVKGVSMNPVDHPNGGKTKSSKIKNIFGCLAKWKPKKMYS